VAVAAAVVVAIPYGRPPAGLHLAPARVDLAAGPAQAFWPSRPHSKGASGSKKTCNKAFGNGDDQKGAIRNIGGSDIRAQAAFIAELFHVAA
jgi:hypothetical protein